MTATYSPGLKGWLDRLSNPRRGRARQAARPGIEALEGRELLTAPVVTLGLSGSPMIERGGHATVTATLSATTDQPVSVNLGFAGTARNLVNYTRSLDTITIPAGRLSGSVTLDAVDDHLKNNDLTVVVNVSGVTNAVTSGAGAAQVVATITDGNFTPTLVIGDVTVDKHASGTRDAMFTILLSNASGQAVTVHYASADGSGAAADHDYLPVSGTLTFAPGETEKTVTVQVVGDTILEPDETFSVVISGATNATISRARGNGTILNNWDFEHGVWSFGAFAFSGASYVAAGSSGGAAVTVNRVGGSTGAASVTLSAFGGNAVPGVNYAATTATLNFADGETSKTVTIPVFNNGPVGGGATAAVLALSRPSRGASLAPQSAAALVIVSTAKPTVAVQSVTSVTDRKKNLTQVVLRLGGDVNAASAQSLSSYRLAVAGRSGSFDAADSTLVPVASAVYNAARRTITLTLSRPFPLTRTVQLRASGLVDALNRPVTNTVALITRNGVSAGLARRK